jgi:predicted kinase
MGVPLLERLGPDGYSSEVSRQVYETLAERARRALLSGRSVVTDAVFGEPAQRQTIQRVAADLGVTFLGCWLNAPEAVLTSRVEQRQNDPSDADAGVVRLQHVRGAGEMDWHLVDAAGPEDTVVQTVSKLLSRDARAD